MNRTLIAILIFAWAGSCLAGCKEEKKERKVISRTVTKKKTEEPMKRPPAEGEEDDVDNAWNDPPTSGQAKLRVVMLSADTPIKGRPSFMAPQFELLAEEMQELLRKEGHEPTGTKKTFPFNPNDAGRYVLELPPGKWRLTVKDDEGRYESWVSDVLTLLGDDSRALDITLLEKKAE